MSGRRRRHWTERLTATFGHICLNTCQWRTELSDEYTDRRTPSHLSHPHGQLRTHAHASTYMHVLDVFVRTYSFTPEFKHPSLS